MSTSTDPVRRRMAAANPAPADADMPAELLTADVLLDVITERSGEMTTSRTRQESTQTPEYRRGNWMWVFTAAFAVVLVTVGVVGVLGRRGSSDVGSKPVATTVSSVAPTTTSPSSIVPTTETLVTTTATSATNSVTEPPVATTQPSIAVPAALQMSWQRIQGQDALESAWLASVTEAGPGLVAGGYVTSGNVREWSLDAAIWVSGDGFEWERIDDPAVFGQTGDALVTRVMATADGVVALGYEGGHRVIWASDDGFDWVRLDEWPYLTMTGPAPEGGAGGGDRMWLSVDGVEWHESMPTGAVDVQVDDLVTGGPGFVAVGREVLAWDVYESRSAIWVSTDGIEWSRVADEEVGGYGAFLTVVAAPGGSPLLAFGDSVLVSDDGLDWHEIAVTEPGPPHSSAVAWTSRGAVVAGIAYGEEGARAWVTEDAGATMYAMESAAFLDDGSDIADLVSFRGMVIAVGGDKGLWIGHHFEAQPITQPGSAGGVWIGSWVSGDEG